LAVILPENSFSSLPKHSNCDWKLQNYLVLSMVNNVTTGTVNTALIAKVNKSEVQGKPLSTLEAVGVGSTILMQLHKL